MSNFTEFGIFMSLLDGRLHKAKELADKFEISTKTIYRQANKLAYAGFPITTYAGKNGGICLAQKFQCQTWFFTENELAYIKNIVSSSNISPVTSSIICAKINELVEKQNFKNAKQQSNRFFVDGSSWFSKKPMSIKNYSAFFDACINSTQIEIQYSNDTHWRIINPYCIVQKEGNYYIYAYCNSKQQFRLFKLCRIQHCKFTQLNFQRENINLETMPWNDSCSRQTKIIIKTSQMIASDINAWATCKKLGENYYSLEAVYNGGLVHKLMEYGNQIKVIKPQELINNLLKECEIITQNYKI